MTSLEAVLRQIHTDLIEARVSFALVGGLGVSARTEPRFTRDADLAATSFSSSILGQFGEVLKSTFRLVFDHFSITAKSNRSPCSGPHA